EKPVPGPTPRLYPYKTAGVTLLYAVVREPARSVGTFALANGDSPNKRASILTLRLPACPSTRDAGFQALLTVTTVTSPGARNRFCGEWRRSYSPPKILATASPGEAGLQGSSPLPARKQKFRNAVLLVSQA